MKITFKSHGTFEINSADIDIKIRAYLKVRQYALLEVTGNKIKFKDVKSSRNRNDYYARVDEGEIKIINNEDKTLLRLKYKVVIEIEYVVILLLIGIALFFLDYYSTIVIIFFLLNFIYKVFYLKFYFLDKMINDPRHPDNLLC